MAKETASVTPEAEPVVAPADLVPSDAPVRLLNTHTHALQESPQRKRFEPGQLVDGLTEGGLSPHERHWIGMGYLKKIG